MKARNRWLTTVAVTALALGTATAFAQQPATNPGTATKPQAAPSQQGAQKPSQQGAQKAQANSAGEERVARQCLDDLRRFAQDSQKEGYWLLGWGNRWGWSAEARARSAAVPPPTAANVGVAGGVNGAPWGGARFGYTSPRYQIRTLYAAANILARRNDQDGCNAVLSELRQLQTSYVQNLKQAGVEPGEIASWREQRLAAAKPVTQLGRAINVADVTGTEVRNLNADELGSVEDVLVDPANGKLTYAIIERGGFLGMGEDYVAVPWQAFRATPGMNMLVLNVKPEVFDKAPKVDPQTFAGSETFKSNAAKVDRYWKNYTAG